MATAADIIATVEGLSGHPLHSDEGVQMGRADAPVTRALVCWMATRDALAATQNMGAELVVAHESLFYPYNARLTPGTVHQWESWPTNRQRRDAIERAGLTVVRIHGSADDICIFDDFASLLGLGSPIAGDGTKKVYEVPPVGLGQLVKNVKEAVGMDHVRVSWAGRSPDETVSRVGLPWGGLGLFVNVGYQQWTLENRCDVLIAGESDSYGFRFSGECGVPMIETSHEASEMPGMRHFAATLAERHAEVQFEFHDNGPAWRWA
jgi:putative NIF3 family GTP cyclohydrolase 1 type 2